MKRTIAGVATSLLLLTAWPVLAQDVGDAGDEEKFSSGDPYFYLAGGLAVGGYLEIKDDVEEARKDAGSPARVKRTAATVTGGKAQRPLWRLG